MSPAISFSNTTRASRISPKSDRNLNPTYSGMDYCWKFAMAWSLAIASSRFTRRLIDCARKPNWSNSSFHSRCVYITCDVLIGSARLKWVWNWITAFWPVPCLAHPGCRCSRDPMTRSTDETFFPTLSAFCSATEYCLASPFPMAKTAQSVCVSFRDHS